MWTIDVGTKDGKHWIAQDRYATKTFDEDGVQGVIALVCDGNGEDCEAVDTAVRLLMEGMHSCTPDDTLLALLRKKFAEVAQRLSTVESGTTATLAVVFDDIVVAGVVGDSLIVAGNGTDNVIVGPEHNVASNEKEREAALKRGARYRDGMIQNKRARSSMSRMLGAASLSSIVLSQPELTALSIPPGNSWVAIMSDGVVNPGHAQYRGALAFFLSLVHQGKTAQQIVERMYPYSEDDATLILLRRA